MNDAANTTSPPQELTRLLSETDAIAKTANRHGHSLGGGGFYASKFSDLHARAVLCLTALNKSLKVNNDPRLNKVSGEIENHFASFYDPKTKTKPRNESKQRILFLLRTEIEPFLASQHTHTPTDSFFPMEIISGTRPYIEAVARQACGSFDMGWYDAAAVMGRRLLETLIIETFEAHKLDGKIKNRDGSFFYLSGLVTALLNETSFNISRNVKRVLPKLKDLGDQSAHSRRYVAKKADLEDVQRDLRITLEELVHLSGLSGTKS